MHRVLFVASEAHPLVKTGGLADVCGALPRALHALGHDVRVLLPAYRDAKRAAGVLHPVAQVSVPFTAAPATLLEGALPGSRVPLWLVDYPPAFDRAGHPYLAPDGEPWHDNAPRFALLGYVAAALARGETAIDWRADVVHCHDWQAGLVPALLAQERERPATVFTIHNLAYQGLFPAATFFELGLPPALWSIEGLEFYGQLCFLKGGLVFADRLNTVSPTYAREIQTPEFGAGMDGLLRLRAGRLSGILNGVDVDIWNPATDPHIARNYRAETFEDKAANKLALQARFGLRRGTEPPLLGMIGRMVEQKGFDLALAAWPALAQAGAQLVVLGDGERAYHEEWLEMARRYPAQLAVQIGYDETLAHQIEAGADIFLMPSRFEPCGLNQMYSLRYGTVPIVHRVGGLADTVTDATPERLAAGVATGLVFAPATAEALIDAARRAFALRADPRAWRRLALAGMRLDFSWTHSAREYAALYDDAIRTRAL